MSAGELRERVKFASQIEESSDYGTVASEWMDEFTEPARIQPLRGTEPVIAQRLTGVQPVVIRVRSSARTREITTAWRITNARTDAVYNIRAVTPDEKKSYIDLLCEQGVSV